MYALIFFLCTIMASRAQYSGHLGSAYHVPPSASQYAAPPAPTGQDGTVVDTPEVAQAKVAHFAEFARAAARAAEDKSQEPGPYAHQFSNGVRPAYTFSGQSNAATPIPNLPYSRSSFAPGPPAPVSFAQSASSSAYHQHSHFAPQVKNFPAPGPPKVPFVPAPLADDGTVIDTPEVAALKAVRLQELAEAEARAYKYTEPLEYPNEGQGQYQPASQSRAYEATRSIPTSIYSEAGTYPSPSQGFPNMARSYSAPVPIYQPKPKNYPQSHSYQSQY